MFAVVTLGVGGYDKLDYCQVPTPKPKKGEVLIKVLACGVNNTEINTRLGWYSSSVNKGTNSTTGESSVTDGGWGEKTPFPFIQGTDCYGLVVIDENDSSSLIGKKVLIRPSMRTSGFESKDHIWMGSDFNGAFAQYVVVPKKEVFPINSSLTDVELGAIPCAYGTAENMLGRAKLKEGETVCITGASGGIGSATVELAKIRKAKVIAITSKSKMEVLKNAGADIVLDRSENLVEKIGEKSIDLLVDNVAGDNFSKLISLIRPGGRVVTSGAIAGPIVDIDLRQIYLKDITLYGCTAWDEDSFPRLIQYIEKGLIHPHIAGTYPLEDIAKAQKELSLRKHFGKFVLIPK
ncbi:alcohol dehydrogenase [Thiospirochaeta perfilievii]|uniref:Alcohol dehydrogenase n=2 Tax=Thiospirochaeta perfilievii TaxID=252967 RepID=A0A5C1QFP8_9SPIO|nr:alcohol dehydrogenase [Thiospirochaeta perfilievii]